MQTEKSQNPSPLEETELSADEQQDNSLSWLLDQELSETSDSLFSVSEEESGDIELTEAEAMMASRPLVRGSNDSDVLSSFVEEEIVVGSVGDSSDIYSGTSTEAAPEVVESNPLDHMIVDHGLPRNPSMNGQPQKSSAGDILGLSDDDDIGEKHLTIRRVSTSTTQQPLVQVETRKPDVVTEPEPSEVAMSAEVDDCHSTPELDTTDDAGTEETQLLDAVIEPELADATLESDLANDLSDGEIAPLGAIDDDPDGRDSLVDAQLEPAPLEEPLSIDALAVDDEELAGTEPADIDYHDDFAAPLDEAASVVSQVTPLLAEIVETLQAQVKEKTDALALASADSLLLNCTLATDDVTSQQSITDGFVPLSAFTSQLPQCLAGLSDDSIDAVRVQLRHQATGVNCNDLLSESFDVDCLEDENSSDEHAPLEFDLSGLSSESPAVDAASDEWLAPVSPLGIFSDREVELLDGAVGELDEDETAQSVAQSLDVAHVEPVAENLVDITAVAGNDDGIDDTLFGDLDADEDWPVSSMSSDSATSDTDASAMGFEEFIQTEGVADAGSLINEQAATTGVGSEHASACDESFDSALHVDTDAATGTLAEQASWQSTPEVDTEEQTPQVSNELFVEQSEVEVTPVSEDIFGDDLDDDIGLEGLQADDVDALLASLDVGEESTDLDFAASLAEAQSAVGGDAAGEDFVEEAIATQTDTQPPEAVTPGSVEAVLAECDNEPETAELEDQPVEEPVNIDPIPSHIDFSFTSASTAELFDDFLDAFLEEGALEVEKLEDAISLWEQDVESADAFAPVPRILHTLKGIAKGVGLQRYGTLIHNFETLLEKLDRPSQAESAAYFRVVNTWLDAAVRGFEKIQDERTDIASELPRVEGQAVVPSGSATEPATAEDKEVAKADDQKVADEGAKALATQQTIRLSADAVDHLMNLTNQAQQLGVRSSQGAVRGKMALAELQGRLSSVRSHISRIADKALMNVTARGGAGNDELDALEMDQYSELQEAASILREGVEDLSELIQMTSRQNALVEALLKQQNSVMSSLRSAIQSARVIPVSRLMPGLRRIVRTVGADLGKDVAFRVLNETGKLDRDNYNRCQVILEHMVRNALDHGIEDAESRRACSKPLTGKITVDVGKEGGDYLIRLSDDGRGMDPTVIRETAYRKGLDVDLENISDAEVLRLIFHKGFSTAAKVSEVSGRGVGMDIVLSELQAIGGSIDIESTVGEGTTFSIRIPSNVTANGALLVSAGEHSYAVPLDGLVAVEYIAVDTFFDAIENNQALELFSLQCYPAYLATLCHGEMMPERKVWSGTIPVIVAGDGEHAMAIAIDDVEQALELVIRTLGSQFSNVPGLAGGATTADGRAIVALDLNALVSSLSARNADRVAMAQEQQDDMLVMVVDDSRTQRLVATSKFDSLGVETVTAENGLAAIDLLNASHRLPDVILLDVEMPVKDGIQTLKELRKSPRYTDIPVIMVTSRTGAKHRKMAAEAGCNGYMGKPFNFPLLVQDINKLTGRRLQLS